MTTSNKKISQFIFLISICLGVVLFTGCSDNSTGTNGAGNGTGNGGGGGNTIGTEPTFDNIQLILNQSCGGAGCHINERTSGVRLDSYQNVTGSVGAQYGELVVKPDSADASPLVDKIESSTPEFGARMPPNGSYLSSSRISQIEEWINNGAENDESGGDSGDGY